VSELINKLNQYRSMGDKLYPEDILVIEDVWELLDEIERLNNIINELEKYINKTKLEEFEKEYGRRYAKTFTQAEVIICNMILNKLQELKGEDKE